MQSNLMKTIVMTILSFVFLGIIIVAQKTVSLGNLGLELVGLVGLLTLLYIYNRKYQ